MVCASIRANVDSQVEACNRVYVSHSISLPLPTLVREFYHAQLARAFLADGASRTEHSVLTTLLAARWIGMRVSFANGDLVLSGFTSDEGTEADACTPKCYICGNGVGKKKISQLRFKWESKVQLTLPLMVSGATSSLDVINGMLELTPLSVTASSSYGKFKKKKGKNGSSNSALGTWTTITIGDEVANLHTSCSQPL